MVGDIIRVNEFERFPSDVLLIGSGASNGSHAFVDTKDLDGEVSKPMHARFMLCTPILMFATTDSDELEAAHCSRRFALSATASASA